MAKSKEKIMEILKAGMQAPSACNQQPWEFYVVTDKEKIQKLSKVTPYTGCATGAPVVIVPVYRTEGRCCLLHRGRHEADQGDPRLLQAER